jgi:hypothetical protein
MHPSITLYKGFRLGSNTKILPNGWTVHCGMDLNVSECYPYECPRSTHQETLIHNNVMQNTPPCNSKSKFIQ